MVGDGQKERKRSPVSNLVISGFNVLLFVPVMVSIPVSNSETQIRWSRNYNREMDFSSCLEMAAGGMASFEMRGIPMVPDWNCSKEGIELNSLGFKLIIFGMILLNLLQLELLTEH